MAVTEGTVPFRGFRTWYQVVGELPAPDGKLPLLVVSGGPGCAHDYLEDLASLADESGRPVVFYDQLGCGRSDHPDDPALWVMDTFVEEVAAVREALGLDRVHLLGHSWGSQVALEYVLGRPAGLVGLVLASPLASAPVYNAEARRLKESLPPEVQQVIDRHEAEGTTDDDAYVEATMAFYHAVALPTRSVARSPHAHLHGPARGGVRGHVGRGMEHYWQPEGLGRHCPPGRAGRARTHHLRSPRPHDPRRGRPDRRRHPRRRVGRLRAQRSHALDRGAM